MALFLTNICKFDGCGTIFPSIGELISHIEEAHIDLGAEVVKQMEQNKPNCLPLSYVLPYTIRDGDTARFLDNSAVHSIADSDIDEADGGHFFREYSTDFIIRFGSIRSGNDSDSGTKPYACPVPGCNKRYKNINGIKYHAKYGHMKDGKGHKENKCQCGRAYKTPQSLKNHILQKHSIPHHQVE